VAAAAGFFSSSGGGSRSVIADSGCASAPFQKTEKAMAAPNPVLMATNCEVESWVVAEVAKVSGRSMK